MNKTLVIASLIAAAALAACGKKEEPAPAPAPAPVEAPAPAPAPAAEAGRRPPRHRRASRAAGQRQQPDARAHATRTRQPAGLTPRGRALASGSTLRLPTTRIAAHTASAVRLSHARLKPIREGDG